MKKTKKQFLTANYELTKKLKNNFRSDPKAGLTASVSRIRIEKMIEDLFDMAYERISPLKMEAFVSPEPLSFEKRKTGGKLPDLKVGDKWAENVFDCAWFHITGKVPEDIADKHVVYLLGLGGEGLVCTSDGAPVQSITCYASDFDYTLGLPLKKVIEDFSENGKIDFWVDAAANDLFGKMPRGAEIFEASVAVCHDEIRALTYDLQALISVYDENPADEYTDEIFTKIKKLLIGYKGFDDFDAARAREFLKPLLETKNEAEQFEYMAVGHAHLDLAWLWPIRETKRKGARTFATQLHNISLYPEYIFGASQAQLYQWIKDDYPQLYSRVKAAAKTPNWDIQGATWVEMDSNLISGESLIRQFYYGKKFFREEFGQDMKILWLPDSFGYSACIPQVMKLAGVPYFLTQKMSWNTVNKFPYHTFKWRGLDGSEVFAHMLPEDTYNGPLMGSRMKFGERNYQERKISDKSIMLFGIGDGGAGPGYEHLERMRRYKDLSHMPKVTPKKALESFKALDDGREYPTHSGELYLEKHQGTYTTQAKNKRFNRKCEFALKNYEYLMLLARSKKLQVPVSENELEQIWKEILLYQFHDILPGSSINRVYEESVARYEVLISRIDSAAKELSEKLFGEGFLNLNSFEYKGLFKFGRKWYEGTVPPMGFAPLKSMRERTDFTVRAFGNVIENEHIRAEFKDGCLVSLLSKSAGREFVRPSSKMGVFTSYTDLGDCWDIRPVNYGKTRKEAKCTCQRIYLDGAQAVAVSEFILGDSSITCRYTLTEGADILAMDIEIYCRQKQKMMRVEFPTSIDTDECNFNVQFGHLARKTTENNSIEKAQYEVSGQKFVDMSGGGYGISLLNDCKYGFRCKNSVIDVDLVRSPAGGPGKNVDGGAHKIKLALMPHSGALSAETYKQAYRLNNDLISVGGSSAKAFSPYSCNNENIVLESVKIAEEKDCAVLRLYNCSEAVQKCEIGFAGYKTKCLTNVMEDEEYPCGKVLEFAPFELKLLKIKKTPLRSKKSPAKKR